MDFVKPTVAIYINDARIMKLYRTSGPNAMGKTLVLHYTLLPYSYTVKNEVCKAHQNVSIHTLFGEKCVYRDILVCMAHFSIYSVYTLHLTP